MAPEQGTVQIPTRTPARSIPERPPRSIAFCIRPWVPDGAIIDGPTPGRKTSLSIQRAMSRARIEARRATRWSRPSQPRNDSSPRPMMKYVTRTAPTYSEPAPSSRRRASRVGVPSAGTALTSGGGDGGGGGPAGDDGGGGNPPGWRGPGGHSGGLDDDLAVHRRAVLPATARFAVDVVRAGPVRDLPDHHPAALGRQGLVEPELRGDHRVDAALEVDGRIVGPPVEGGRGSGLHPDLGRGKTGHRALDVDRPGRGARPVEEVAEGEQAADDEDHRDDAAEHDLAGALGAGPGGGAGPGAA